MNGSWDRYMADRRLGDGGWGLITVQPVEGVIQLPLIPLRLDKAFKKMLKNAFKML